MEHNPTPPLANAATVRQLVALGMPVPAQDLFEAVARHMFAQGRQSRDDSLYYGACCYRSPDGLMCAVGAVLPDAVYCPIRRACPSTS